MSKSSAVFNRPFPPPKGGGVPQRRLRGGAAAGGDAEPSSSKNSASTACDTGKLICAGAGGYTHEGEG